MTGGLLSHKIGKVILKNLLEVSQPSESAEYIYLFSGFFGRVDQTLDYHAPICEHEEDSILKELTETPLGTLTSQKCTHTGVCSLFTCLTAVLRSIFSD